MRELEHLFYTADIGKPTQYAYLLSDFSAFGNPIKKPLNIRGNYRKSMKLLLENKIDRFIIMLKSGDYFKIEPPVLTRKETEPKKIELTIEIPPGNAIKIFSINDGFFTYIVNKEGIFYETDDYREAEKETGAYF